MPLARFAALGLLALASTAVPIRAQDNYEIQVYPGETLAAGNTMVELHSNFTVQGSKQVIDGMVPTEHALHETIEITHGWNDWFETGLYIFTSLNQYGYGYGWVGDHIRPRVRVPENWRWPVGVSLSVEFGYQRALYSPDTWTLEIRPIVDKQLGKWYLAFNPTLDRSFHGPSVSQGLVFSPNVKVGYDITKVVNMGFEYYGSLGTFYNWLPISQQQHQIFPVVDLNFSPQWEFNFGVGLSATGAADHLIVKMILGRRFDFGKSHTPLNR